jgi:hypothetical protein
MLDVPTVSGDGETVVVTAKEGDKCQGRSEKAER